MELVQEFSDDDGGVSFPSLDFVVQSAHVGLVDASREAVQRRPDPWFPEHRGRADDWHGVVGREVVPVICKHREIERFDQPRRGVSSNEIHLPLRQGPVGERQIQHLG